MSETRAGEPLTVTLACGDPSWSQGPQAVAIQGAVAVNNVTTAVNQFVTVTNFPASVTNGKLTVTLGGAAVGNAATGGSGPIKRAAKRLPCSFTLPAGRSALTPIIMLCEA